MSGSSWIVEPSSGKAYDLGVITLRPLGGARQTMGEFAVGEFSGGVGPWTVLHGHGEAEAMFDELSKPSPDSLRYPKTPKRIVGRFDPVPV